MVSLVSSDAAGGGARREGDLRDVRADACATEDSGGDGMSDRNLLYFSFGLHVVTLALLLLLGDMIIDFGALLVRVSETARDTAVLLAEHVTRIADAE